MGEIRHWKTGYMRSKLPIFSARPRWVRDRKRLERTKKNGVRGTRVAQTQEGFEA